MNLEHLLLAALLASPALSQGEPPKKSPVTQRVQGRVLDAAGNPVAGAGFATGTADKITTAEALERPIAKSGEDGTFQFDVAANEDEDRVGIVVVVAAPGKAAMRWMTYVSSSASRAGTPREPVKTGDLRLLDGVTLKGRVRSTDGQPLVGARVETNDLLALRTRGYWQPTARSYGSMAVAGADGSFVLPCSLPSAIQIVGDAEGHYRRTLSPVSAGQPIVMELEPSGFVSGRVVDASGAPLAANVSVSYEADNNNAGQSQKVGADGTFKFTLRYPCRYRASAYRKGGLGASKESGVLSGPQNGIELSVQKPQKKSLVLRAVDAATGEPIPAFRAFAYWYQGIDPSYVESQFETSSVPSEDGKVTLPEPQNAQAPTVRVGAEGFAPVTLDAVEMKEEGESTAEAKLPRESVVQGRVLDEKTGKPVADCELVARAVKAEEPGVFRGYREPRLKPSGKGAKTAEDGSFKLGGLGKGVFEIFAVHRDRPAGKPVRVTLGEQETQKDAEIRIPEGAVLSGKITGAGTVPGLKLRIERQNPNRGYSVYQQQQQDDFGTEGVVPLGPDGSFRFEGQANGTYDLALLYPATPRVGSTLRLPIEVARLRGKDVVRDIDVADDLPGRVAGKVAVEGVPLPVGRWLVTAVETTDPNEQQVYYSNMDLLSVGRRALIENDGSYELLLPPGEHRLQVVDLETGVLMAKDSEKVDVLPAKRVQRDLQVKAVEVRVRLRGEREGKYIASRLKVDGSIEPDKQNGNMFFAGGNANPGPFEINEAPAEVAFLVPPGDVKLSVYSGANRLFRGRHPGNLPTLGDAELKAELGKPCSLELKVEAPPEIDDDAAKDKEKDAAVPLPVLGGRPALPAPGGGLALPARPASRPAAKPPEPVRK